MSGSPKTEYACSECNAIFPRWKGQCLTCHAWNSLVERKQEQAPARPSTARSGHWAGKQGDPAQVLQDVLGRAGPSRLATGVGELDRVLGGGLTRGSVVLLAGDPGIGKSTLLLMALAKLGGATKCLYVTGEESLEQVAERAARMGGKATSVRALAEVELSRVMGTLDEERPTVAVIDSIQTMYSEELTSAAGTVSQVRECGGALTQYAKRNGCSIFLVGHVTKNNEIAGPRVLEHMVDTVLYFEGDPQSSYRLVRAMKNRYGAANEIGVFEMREDGLASVDNPSEMFLSEGRVAVSGSCVALTQDGRRPLAVEIQALVGGCSGPVPRRLAVGLDPNRLAMLLAMLHRHAKFEASSLDVFVNAVGGLKVVETAADLPVLLAMLSSFTGLAVPVDMACFGEIGLTGEVRPVRSCVMRLEEAAARGFKRVIVPARGLPAKIPAGLVLSRVHSVAEAVETLVKMAEG